MEMRVEYQVAYWPENYKIETHINIRHINIVDALNLPKDKQ